MPLRLPVIIGRRMPAPCTARGQVKRDALATDKARKGTTEPLQQLQDLPVVKGAPFVGKMLEFNTAEFIETIPDLFEEHGEHFMVDLGPLGHHLCIRTPSEIQHVLSSSTTFVENWPASVAKLISATGENMSNEDAKSWRKGLIRAINQDTLDTLHLPLMVDSFQSSIRKFAQSGEEVHWRTQAQKMAFGVASRAILGDKFTDEDLEYMFPRLICISTSMLALDFGLKEGVPFTQYWRAMQARKELEGFFTEKMEKILEDRAELEASNTIVGRLLTSMYAEGMFSPSTPSRVIAQRLAGEMVFLQFAGTDTTAYTLTRSALLLAKHPKWHQALWEEQQKLMEEYGDTIDRRVLSRSPVAVAMAQESLRLLPSVATAPRTAIVDSKVGNVSVPAGTPIMCALAAAAVQTGSGSPTFDPAQWLSEDHSEVTLNKDPGMMVFGKGPRSCPGMSLAQMEIILVLVLLGREVQEVVATEEELQRPFTTVAHPTNCPLKLVARA